jgi:hypothetical protein
MYDIYSGLISNQPNPCAEFGRNLFGLLDILSQVAYFASQFKIYISNSTL